MKSLGVAQRIFEKISLTSSVISTILIVIMMFSVVLDVTMRWFKIPIYGVYELQGFLVGMTVYLGLAKTQQERKHIGVNILSQYLPTKLVSSLLLSIYTASMVFFGWLTYLLGSKAIESYVTGEVITGITRIPLFPLKIVMTFGLGLLTIQLFIDAVKEFKSLFSKQNEGPANITGNDKTEVPEQ